MVGVEGHTTATALVPMLMIWSGGAPGFWMAAMAPDDEDAHTIAHNSKEEVIGEALELGPPEVGFDEVVSAGTLGSLEVHWAK